VALGSAGLGVVGLGVVGLGVVGLGVVGLGVVGLGVVGLGVVGLGVVWLGVVVGLDVAGVVAARFVGLGFVGAGFAGLGFAGVVGGTGVPDRDDSGCGPDHGGAAALGVGVGPVEGNQVVTGSNGFPTGRDSRLPDRDGPAVRSARGPNEVVPGGACVVAESWAPNGTKNKVAASATTTAASAPSFRSGNRRRLCRGPELRICRPRWNCNTC
jgi:hypothetical protein